MGAEAVYLTVQQAAEYLNRTEAAVRALIQRGCIPHRKVGGRICFLRDELDEWVRRSPGTPVDELLYPRTSSEKRAKKVSRE